MKNATIPAKQQDKDRMNCLINIIRGEGLTITLTDLLSIMVDDFEAYSIQEIKDKVKCK